MVKDSSPEEKLLNLIRKRRKPKEEKLAKKSPKSDLYLSHLKSSYQKQRFPVSSEDKTINVSKFKFVKKILFFVIILSFICILYIISTSTNYRNLKSASTRDKSADSSTTLELTEPKPYMHYSQQFNKRDIFKSRFLGGDDIGAYSSAGTERLLKTIKVVGIILDDIPQVIIEDTKEKKTYFLNKGDFFNQFLVEDILEGKAILSLDGEKVELVP